MTSGFWTGWRNARPLIAAAVITNWIILVGVEPGETRIGLRPSTVETIEPDTRLQTPLWCAIVVTESSLMQLGKS